MWPWSATFLTPPSTGMSGTQGGVSYVPIIAICRFYMVLVCFVFFLCTCYCIVWFGALEWFGALFKVSIVISLWPQPPLSVIHWPLLAPIPSPFLGFFSRCCPRHYLLFTLCQGYFLSISSCSICLEPSLYSFPLLWFALLNGALPCWSYLCFNWACPLAVQ